MSPVPDRELVDRTSVPTSILPIKERNEVVFRLSLSFVNSKPFRIIVSSPVLLVHFLVQTCSCAHLLVTGGQTAHSTFLIAAHSATQALL